MQEIITGEPPFREIPFGPSMIMAVVQDRRTPRVPELLAEPTSPRAVLMYGVLHRCWRYDPMERATAKEVAALVRPTPHNMPQPLIVAPDDYARRSLAAGHAYTQKCTVSRRWGSDWKCDQISIYMKSEVLADWLCVWVQG
jgi:hypothetical protein